MFYSVEGGEGGGEREGGREGREGGREGMREGGRVMEAGSEGAREGAKEGARAKPSNQLVLNEATEHTRRRVTFREVNTDKQRMANHLPIKRCRCRLQSDYPVG